MSSTKLLDLAGIRSLRAEADGKLLEGLHPTGRKRLLKEEESINSLATRNLTCEIRNH